MGKKKKNKQPDNTIAQNKKARFEYKLLEEFEAGIALEGWEVKSCREGKVQLVDSYVMIKNGEAYLYGANITPLLSASTHITPDPKRLRKLLLHKHELNKMIGAVERKGHTIAALSMYWIRGRAKLKLAIVEGKKAHDKRETIKARDWARDKQRILKQGN